MVMKLPRGRAEVPLLAAATMPSAGTTFLIAYSAAARADLGGRHMINLPRRKFLRLAVGTAVLPAVSRFAWAQAYPTRPITLVVPFAPGGTTDVVGRVLADRMKVSLRQPVVVENVAGANGTIGVGRVARAAPDGYTLDLGLWGTHVVNGAFYPLRYDLRNDFEPISLVVANPLLIFGRNSLPAQDIKELVAWLRANPDKASQGTTSAGTHAVGAFFQKETGTRYQFVPYRGAAPAVQDLIGGQIDLVIDTTVHLSQVRAGRIKAYAVLSEARLDVAPDVPTIAEAGLPALTVTSWFGLFAPKGTPKDVVRRLNAAVVETLDDPAAAKRLTEIGFGLFPRERWTPEALGTLKTSDIEKWWPIIKAANIKGE
jgi:tripartite-type tricarboxylate transporter receptor subunit TctC